MVVADWMSVSRERHWFERTANDAAVQRGFQLFAGTEVVALQHLLDAAVEALDHAVGLGVLWRGQTVLDAKVGAELVERVLAGGRPFAQTEQAVGEFLTVIGQHRANTQRAGPFEIAQEPAGIGGSPGVADADEDPACGAINGDEQVAP